MYIIVYSIYHIHQLKGQDAEGLFKSYDRTGGGSIDFDDFRQVLNSKCAGLTYVLMNETDRHVRPILIYPIYF